MSHLCYLNARTQAEEAQQKYTDDLNKNKRR